MLPDNFLDTKAIGLDLETTSLYGNGSDPYRDRVLLISLSNGKQHIVLQPGPWLEQLWKYLKDNTVIIHNAEFDLRFLRALGFEGYPRAIWDTLIVERVLTCGMLSPCDLSATVWRHCSHTLDKSTRGTFKAHLSNSFTERQLQYAIDDVKFLLPVARAQRAKCRELNLLETAELENKLVPVVAAMEYLGVSFNVDTWDRIMWQEQEQAKALYQEAVLALGSSSYGLDLFDTGVNSVNINSFTELQHVLNDRGMDLENTQADTLETYAKAHPKAVNILQPIIAYKKTVKRIGFDYPKYINPVTGRIHTSYNQIRAKTGRFASSNPNLQNVVAKDNYRACFGNEPGFVYITADYAQQEVRGLAEASGDKNLKEACRHGDPHLAVTRMLYDDDTIGREDERRRVGKGCNLGMNYGAGAQTIASSTGISLANAEDGIRRHKAKFSDAFKWSNLQVHLAEEQGWVATLSGRRRWFLGLDPEKKYGWGNAARNAPIQGLGKDAIARAMVYVDRTLKGIANLVLTVHDELVVRVPVERAKECEKIIRREMERAADYYIKSIPNPVDLVTANHWRKA